MFISHCHVGTIGFGSEQSNPEVGTLRNLKQILDAVGVEGAVVFEELNLSKFSKEQLNILN